MKRFLTILFVALLATTTFAQFSGSGSGTQNDPYLIFNPIQLDQMRNFTNQAGVYFKLMTNIDLAEFIAENYPNQGWSPIGTYSKPFKGVFNGNGKQISSLTINRPSTDNVGFFSYAEGATITAVSFVNVDIAGQNKVGCLVGCGRIASNTFINISVSGKVEGENEVGGIMGYGNSCTMQNVSFNGSINGNGKVGGVIGNVCGETTISNTSVFSNLHADSNHCGGFAGYLSRSLTISSSTFEGSVEGVNYVGGFVGCGYGISLSSSSALASIRAAGDYCGGAVGKAGQGDMSGDISISTTHVSGDVLGGNFVGGIVGCLEGHTNSWAEVLNCYFCGSVVGKQKVGGVCGLGSNKYRLKRCYSNARISGVSYVGGIAGEAYGYENVAINSLVKGYNNVARICVGGGSSSKSLNTTKVSTDGIVLSCDDSQEHGQGVGNTMLKYAASYQGINWDFASIWTILDTESYPFFPWQEAPPIINNAVADSTIVSGNGVNGSVITISVNGNIYQTICNGNSWSVRTEPLAAGSFVYAVAKSSGKQPSYRVEKRVKFKGLGTETNPYQVYTPIELANINGEGYYCIMNDIDVSSITPWVPIGQYEVVTAHIDGDDHTISNLTINTTSNYQGLFNQCYNTSVKNIRLSNVNVIGGDSVGSLIGSMIDGTITNCHTLGSIHGENYSGGLVGYVENSTIELCSVKGNINGSEKVGGITSSLSGEISKTFYQGIVSSQASSSIVGGLVGDNKAAINTCYTEGSVACNGASSYVGGLVGKNDPSATITNSYSLSNVTGTQNVGGLIGRNYGGVSNCYAQGNLVSNNIAGGIVGYNDGTSAMVNNCFAMNHTINANSSTGIAIRVIGGITNGAPTPSMNNYALKTMAVSVNGIPQRIYDDNLNGVAVVDSLLKLSGTYSNATWNMSSVWGIEENLSYPYLRHFTKTATITFLNYDGSILQSSDVIQGRLPSYNGAIPTKPADAQYTYMFAGWTPEISVVDSDATYTATYTPVLREYTITWKNDDGTIIDQTVIAYGATPTHSAPTKQATAQYTYTFKGWNPVVVSVTGDAVYTATFDSIINRYVVVFRNEDNTPLQIDTIAYGTMPEYRGTTPTKASTAQYSYTFAGWTPTISIVTGAATYTATFSEKINKYVVIFRDEDSTLLQLDTLAYGTLPSYRGVSPSKQATAQFTYTFAGWSPSVTSVTGVATYTATYTATVNKYLVVFVNEDGTELQRETLDYGSAPVYRGATPSKQATAQYTYVFSGWTPAISSVTGTATYTATFTAVVNKYLVTFVNEDGTLLQMDSLAYGSLPVYHGTTPTKAATAQYTYTFAGWDAAIVDVTGNATYRATYTSAVNKYVVVFQDEDGILLQRDTLEYGAMPIYRGAAPTKAATAQYTFTFNGWNPTVVSVTGDATYEATYTSVVNKYVVMFCDEDSTLLQIDTLAYGTLPEYRGTTPTKSATVQYTYTFGGWTPSTVSVTENAVYYATYTFIVNKYVVVFQNEDGTPLQRDSLEYGAMPVYRGAAPTKDATAQYTYTFNGWNPTIVSVSGDATYEATYTSVVNKYVVMFLNEDSTLLQIDTLSYGTLPMYRGTTPTKAATAQYTYTFTGWDAAIVDVTQNATYRATYTSIVNKYVVAFQDEDGTLLQQDSVEYGVLPTYRGIVPTKAATDQYTYTFNAWNPSVVSVTGDATYEATYTSTVNKYVVIFQDEDGTLLQRDTLEYGALPVYRGITPTKAATAEHTYAFNGWSPAIVSVGGNATYVATYSEIVNKYVILFLNEDNTLLQVDTLEFGILPVYRGQTPVKEQTAQYSYEFAGWSPVIALVTGNASYVATYTSIINKYLVTFLNSDSTLIEAKEWEYGTMPTCAEPTKEPDELYTYTFREWNPTVVAVVAEATYVATYEATLINSLDGVPESMQKPIKVMENGKMYILMPDGTKYSATGKKVE